MRHRPLAPTGNDDASLADWLEACIVILDVDELSRSDIQRLLADEPLDEGDFEAITNVEDEEIEVLVREDSRVDRMLTVIGRRQAQAPVIYPFRADDDLVTYITGDATCAYVFLLWLTVPKTRLRQEQEHFDYAERKFDELVAIALRHLLGGDAKAMLFARKHARDDDADPVARPTSFPEAIKKLRTILGTYGLELPPDDPDAVPEGLPPRTFHDGGVDVVAWRGFRDERPGCPTVLAQSTIQREWHDKAKDVVVELWTAWVVFPTPFQRVLAIPWSESHDKNWLLRNRVAGLILDRMRLCEALELLLEDAVAFCDPALRDWLRDERTAYMPQDEAA